MGIVRKGRVPEDVKSGGGIEEESKAADSKFSEMEEKIGELRAGLIEREKEMGAIAANATRALDMVGLIRPETLAVDMQKSEAKVEAIEAKLDSNRQMMESIINDMKDFRNRLRTFTGLEEVARMSADIRKELTSLKVAQSRMEVNASKVESMFIEIQKKYAEFTKAKDTMADMGKRVNEIDRDLGSLKAQSFQFASKAELGSLGKSVESQVEWMRGFTNDSRPFRDFFQKVNYLEGENNAMKDYMEKMNAGFIRLSDGLDSLSNFISGKIRELEGKWLETERIKASIGETKEMLDRKIDAVMDLIEEFADKPGSPGQVRPPVQAYSRYRVESYSNQNRIRNYIWECMSRGYSIEAIERVLRNAGYREDEVRAAISSLK